MALYCLEINDALPVVGFNVVMEIKEWVQYGCFVPVEKVTKVSDHGRLVDADALLEKCPELYEYLAMMAPTVIPAKPLKKE